MIGLKRGTVKLSPHHQKWDQAFRKEKSRTLEKLDNSIVAIEHIGSTAIPKIPAKPIIDMSLGVWRLKDAKKFIKPLDALGYHFYKKFQQQILFARGPDRKRTHYLHVMKYNGAKWKSDLLFREFLLRHPARARAYGALKQKLAKQYPNDREKYTFGKSVFITKTIQLASHPSKVIAKQ